MGAHSLAAAKWSFSTLPREFSHETGSALFDELSSLLELDVPNGHTIVLATRRSHSHLSAGKKAHSRSSSEESAAIGVEIQMPSFQHN